MCVVIDLDAVCVICLQPSKEFKSVFTTDVDSSDLLIAQKISILSELKVDQNNHALPNKICVKCLEDLKAAWRFRKNCQAAVTIFQTIVSLDLEDPEEANASKDLEEKQIKVPQGLQIKRVEQTTGKSSEHSPNDFQAQKTARIEEYVIVNDKDTSTLFEELESHENVGRQEDEANEFQSVDGGDSNDGDIEEHAQEESTLVEFYINEEGIAEELSIKVETDTASNSINKQTEKKLCKEKESKPTSLLTKTNKPIQRGRPRKKTKPSTDEEQLDDQSQLQNSFLELLSKLKKEDANTSENKPKTSQKSQVRQVKSRKRKSLSPETKPLKICELCGNSYRFQHALNAHMRRHYNDKPFPCEFCDKAFVSNVELRRHIRVHTGQKPYPCQYCERRFSDFGSRIKHERTHTGERPYACGTCGKAFAYPHVLSVHLRTHTGEKRFRCDYCNKGFTKKAYLQSHIGQHHSEANNYENVNDEATNSSQEKFILRTEYVTEEAVEENAEYEEERIQETGSSRIEFKKDDSNDEDTIHEIVEVLPDEYTIRVR